MHPNPGTTALISGAGAGGRVMPGVRWLRVVSLKTVRTNELIRRVPGSELPGKNLNRVPSRVATDIEMADTERAPES